MTTKQCIILDNLNQVVILMLTLLGLSVDGFEASDSIFIIATSFWLWKSTLLHYEVLLFSNLFKPNRSRFSQH